ncbi:hypothetical protein WJX81_006108 [Elliptochloris bilobata]|uniref:Cytochrome P450 n=1 Tax=Elliptochloris bilobata TaxID=381761 RepID=A0AAW1QAG1_9CHLO
MWLKAVVITDPMLAHQVLSREAGLEKPHSRYKSPMDLLTSASHRSSLVTHDTNSALWRLVRKGIAPAFATNNIKKEFPRVVEIGQQLVRQLHACGPEAVVDMDLAAQRESLDVLGLVGFGVQFGATRSLLGGDKPGSALRALQNGMAEVQRHMGAQWRRWQVMRVFPDVRRGREELQRYQRVVEDLLAQLRARGPPVKDDTTIAAHLLRIVDPATGRGLPDELLAPEIGILYLAGVETSAHTVAFVLYLVSQHPEVEAKIAAELDGLGLLATARRPRPRLMAYEDLAQLRYLSCVIKEAMRLYPVVPMGTARQAPDTGMELGGYAIPPGAMLWVFFSAMFRSPHVWDAPDEFRPERWADVDAEFYIPAGSLPASAARPNTPEPAAQQTPSKGPVPNPEGWSADGDAPASCRPKRFIPFSSGARDCVGRSLATINYKVLLALLLGNFRFRLAEEMGGVEGVEASICMRATLQFRDGLKMHCLPCAA